MLQKCKICNEEKYFRVDFNNLFLRTNSYNLKLHDFENRVCSNCGVVYHYPQISEKQEGYHYQNNFRKTKFPIYLKDNERIDFPLQFDQTGISFQRFYNFYKIIKNLEQTSNNLKINERTTILDYGAYQGAFLYACKKVWGSKTIAYDNNEDGLKFAREFLKIDKTYKTKKIDTDEFDEKIDICTAIQVLEHLRDPKSFFLHIREKVLKANGYLYIEVPCALTSEFSNPVHLHMFTKNSLKYLFESCGFQIIHLSEEEIYRYENVYPIKRHIQTMVHCLAKNVNDIKNHSHKIDIGNDIFVKLKKSHFKNSNILYFKKIKKLFIELIKMIYYGIFLLIGLFNNKLSFNIFLKMNKFLQKFRLLKKISRK
tara:strand:- start:1295 stop:2401 length:1107 start_codon:yes stop_codon:yes gene_type:complete